MSLHAQDFDTPDAIVRFVATNSIPQANIQKITFVQGRWWLFYWQ